MGEWYRMQKEHKQGAFATLAGLGVHHSDSIGSLRIGTLLEERIILPISSYKPLIQVSNCNTLSSVRVLVVCIQLMSFLIATGQL